MFVNVGTFYFFGVRDEFDASTPFTVLGCSKKLLLFMVEMFIWEIWFDFGHYWGHRMGHYFKWLYEFGHKYHHENISPDAFDGLNITFDDAMLLSPCTLSIHSVHSDLAMYFRMKTTLYFTFCRVKVHALATSSFACVFSSFYFECTVTLSTCTHLSVHTLCPHSINAVVLGPTGSLICAPCT